MIGRVSFLNALAILRTHANSVVDGASVSSAASLPIQPPETTVGLLPTCNGGSKGYTYRVSDANSPTWNAALAGGGSVEVLALCNGTSWTAH